MILDTVGSFWVKIIIKTWTQTCHEIILNENILKERQNIYH